MSSVYNSATHGRIPLSKEGKNLMQALRNAIVVALPTGSYDANRRAIARARGDLALYMSNLEGNSPMCTKASTVDHFGPSPGKMFNDLRQRILDLSQSHGRERVLTLLRQYGAESLSDLKLRQAESLQMSLEKLALELPQAEHALATAVAAVNTQYGADYSSSHRDRALFAAGRTYERETARY